jgi:hypothetical protein
MRCDKPIEVQRLSGVSGAQCRAIGRRLHRRRDRDVGVEAIRHNLRDFNVLRRSA